MLLKNPGARMPGRATGRWLGVIAAAAVFAFGASACSADTAALTNKSAGDEADGTAVIEQVNDPVVEGDLVAPKEPDGGDGASYIPDHLEDDIKEAQEEQAQDEVAVIEDDGDPVKPPVDAEDAQLAAEVNEATLKSGGVPTMEMQMRTAVALKRVAWSQSPHYIDCSGGGTERPPYTLKASETVTYCFQPSDGVLDAWVDVRYQIGDTPQILHITSRVPVMGDNVLTCEILNNGDNKPVYGSKYVCEKSWRNSADGYGHGNQPKPYIEVKEKPTKEVKDLAEAQKLIKENCVDKTGRGACDYSAATQKAYLQPSTEWRLYGGPQSNCNTKKEEEHNVKDSVKIGWEDRFGVSVHGEAKLFKFIKLGLEASYEHSVTEERKFEEERKGFVEYGTVHAWYVQPGMVRTTGDITIVTPYNIYKLKNQQFDIPLATNWQPIDGRGQLVPAVTAHSTHVKIRCVDGRPADDLPDFPARGIPTGSRDVNGLGIKPGATFTSAPESLAAKKASEGE